MRLVVRAAEGMGGDKIFVSLDDGPVMPEQARKMAELGCAPHELLGSLHDADEDTEPVRVVGERLLRSLKAHPAIDLSVQALLGSPAFCPIYVRLVTAAAAEYPWETLFDSGGSQFLALQHKWPIARIAEIDQTEKEIRHFAPPLRILAILSAVGVDAAEEWRSLWTAVNGCELPLELHVIAGQHSVKAEVDAIDDPRVTCELLASAHQLRSSIQQSGAHLIHLFCHGKGSGAQTPMLMLGTPQDHARNESSIWLDKSSFTGLAPDAWLVTLNCCKGASDAQGARSLAHELVSVGYPAAIGMREPISADDASLFTRAFYESLVGELAEKFANPAEVVIELTTLLNEPRIRLRDKFATANGPGAAAATRGEWTYPILYVRPEPLKIRAETTAKAHDQHGRDYLVAKLDVLERARLELHRDTPPEALTAIDAEIDKIRRQIDET